MRRRGRKEGRESVTGHDRSRHPESDDDGEREGHPINRHRAALPFAGRCIRHDRHRTGSDETAPDSVADPHEREEEQRCRHRVEEQGHRVPCQTDLERKLPAEPILDPAKEQIRRCVDCGKKPDNDPDLEEIRSDRLRVESDYWNERVRVNCPEHRGREERQRVPSRHCLAAREGA